MAAGYEFNRKELAGSLGDLGTILPLAMGMILVNGLSASGLFFSVGLFYILTGIYFKVTVPVQPMKVIGAYAIATAMTSQQILASSVLMGVFLLICGLTGAINIIGKYTPKAVIRGVQLSTGTLLMSQAVKMMIGTSKFQQMHHLAEPYLKFQSLGPIPIGMIMGIAAGFLTLYFLDNKKLPAGLIVVLIGLLVGILIGTGEGMSQLRLGIYLPDILRFTMPVKADFMFAAFALVLPQIPMTIGNAVIANADLSKEYFGETSQKVTYSGLCISMALGNFLSFIFAGMPLCHGAGGLAAHYRFGARTAGSNLMIGLILILLVLFFKEGILAIVYLIPMAFLGVLLLFAGSQLALTILDIRDRKDMFIIVIMLGITLATNLSYAFIIGCILAYMLKSKRLAV